MDQVTEEIVAVTRHCPATHRSYIMMAHTAFWSPPPHATPTEQVPNTHYTNVPPLTIPGAITVMLSTVACIILLLLLLLLPTIGDIYGG